MKNLALGRYIPHNTLIHRLDPRIKLITMIILIVCVFLPIGFIGYGFLGLFCLLMLKNVKIKMITIFRLLKHLWFMFAFLFIFNILTYKTGTLLFEYNWFQLYSGGIYQTLYIVIRLAIMLAITTILTTSTKPLDLTYGLEALLSPLKVVKFPAHEIAMIISIALRFIPTLLEETDRIMKAQASRGSILSEGKLKEKVSSIISLVIPLFFSAFQRSDELADAMEARGYNPSAKRTRYRILKLEQRDLWSTLVVFLVLGVCVFVSMNHTLIDQLLGVKQWW